MTSTNIKYWKRIVSFLTWVQDQWMSDTDCKHSIDIQIRVKWLDLTFLSYITHILTKCSCKHPLLREDTWDKGNKYIMKRNLPQPSCTCFQQSHHSSQQIQWQEWWLQQLLLMMQQLESYGWVKRRRMNLC